MRGDFDTVLNYLQLIRSENLGPRRVQALLQTYGSAKAALAALTRGASLPAGFGLKKPIALISRAEAERELRYAEKIGAYFITREDGDYPAYLREIDSPPPLLAVKGNAALLSRPAVAIVGSRAASAAGGALSSRFARALGEAGFVIVSGFARGIDTYAHSAALQTGTIAVVAGGVDHIYPPENKKLYQDILAEGGVFISEMPLGHRPRAVDFPRRNRLIAGLPLGLLVIEASERSGSLISARFAAEAGRIVFAAPGSPLDPRAKGTNGLIKNGAGLADDPQDIIDILAPLHAAPRESQTRRAKTGTQAAAPSLFSAFAPADNEKDEEALSARPGANAEQQANIAAAHKSELSPAEKQRLEQSLSLAPIAIDNLAFAAQLPLSRLYLGLMELELAGRLIRHHGGMVSRLPD